MPSRFIRRRVLAAGASVFASLAWVRRPGEAAEFDYKCGHNLAVDSPMNVRSVELWNAVANETHGRLVVHVFPNSALGSDTSTMAQVRSGATQLMCLASGSGVTLVPALGIAGIGFAFRSEPDAIKAMDGPLGAELRRQLTATGFVVVAPPTFELGLRQITNSAHPVSSPADLAGLKIRVPATKISIDMFRTLGANPTPIDFAEAYTALQTHLVDGTELPLSTIESSRFFEVQKYLSIVNHTWAGYWLVCNPQAWSALPSDIQTIVQRNASKYIRLQQRDIILQEPVLRDKLGRQGMSVNIADAGSFRAKLAPYYARWKAAFGPALWSLLEATSGPLG